MEAAGSYLIDEIQEDVKRHVCYSRAVVLGLRDLAPSLISKRGACDTSIAALLHRSTNLAQPFYLQLALI